MNQHQDGRQSDAAEAQSFLMLRLDDELYAIDSPSVREIVRWREPTPLPGAPPAIPGIIGQRGVVLPVIDLRQLLGMTVASPARATRFVIVQHDEVDLALLVDAVLDLVALDPAKLEPPPGTLDQERSRLLRAIARVEDRPAGLLDLGALVVTLQG